MLIRFLSVCIASISFIATASANEVISAITPQTATYEVDYGSINLGEATYKLTRDGNHFTYTLDSKLSLLILSDDRQLKSEFTLDGDYLKPQRFTQNRQGTGRDFSEQTAFATAQGKVYTRYKDERGEYDYSLNLFDPLMAQLQFRLDMQADKKDLHFKIIKENEIDEYKFKVIGKERLTIDSGTYDTVKIEVIRKSKKRQTFFWMAPKLGYLPIRLTHYEKGSKQLDIKLLSYQYQQPQQTAVSLQQ